MQIGRLQEIMEGAPRPLEAGLNPRLQNLEVLIFGVEEPRAAAGFLDVFWGGGRAQGCVEESFGE